MIDFLIAVYRANPVRPHCRATHHVWLCRFLGLSRTSVGNDAIPHRSRWCPAQGN